MSNESLQLSGTLYRKFDTQQINEKMTKRDFVVETDDSQYPQLVKFELINDKCSIIDSYSEGTKVTVKFNIRGREWKKDETQTTYFVSLNAWRIERDGNGGSAYNAPVQSAPIVQNQQQPATSGVDDDLPF